MCVCVCVCEWVRVGEGGCMHTYMRAWTVLTSDTVHLLVCVCVCVCVCVYLPTSLLAMGKL